MHEAIEQIEKELVGERHWSLMGEASAKNRQTNSLLELHLELPQYLNQRNLEAFPDTLGVTNITFFHFL